MVYGSTGKDHSQSTTIGEKTASEIALLKTCVHRLTQRHVSSVKDFVQELRGDDTDRRVQCFELVKSQKMLAEDKMFSDEMCLNGYVNRHNSVYWTQYRPNPHVAVDVCHGTNPKITVWCAIQGTLLEQVFLEGGVNAEIFLQLLNDVLGPHMDEMQLAV
jgi:hypothetical protein